MVLGCREGKADLIFRRSDISERDEHTDDESVDSRLPDSVDSEADLDERIKRGDRYAFERRYGLRIWPEVG